MKFCADTKDGARYSFTLQGVKIIYFKSKSEHTNNNTSKQYNKTILINIRKDINSVK